MDYPGAWFQNASSFWLDVKSHWRAAIRDVKRAAHGGPNVIEVNSAISYFFGVSTGVGTLSITEDDPRMPVI